MIFSKTNFGPTEVYVLGSILRTLHNFSTGIFFKVERDIRAKKTRILSKNSFFANKTSCGLTALSVKPKIYFVVLTLQIKKETKIYSIVFCIECSQWLVLKIFYKLFVVLEMGTSITWAPAKNVPVWYEKLKRIENTGKKNKKICKLSNVTYAAIIRKVFWVNLILLKHVERPYYILKWW